MDTNALHNATFSEVYRFLKDKPDDAVFQCFTNLFGAALLFFPALMCQDVAAITALATGATLAGAGVASIVHNAAKSAFALFKNKDHGDYTVRYQQMQIAQVMLVYASYFDTLSQYLPDENREIALSADEKWKISQAGFQAYLQDLKASAQDTTPSLLNTPLALPNPTQKFSQYKQELKDFYSKLNAEFIIFFERLSFWEEIDPNQREYFSDLLDQLPEKAVCTYDQQYFELSKEFPEFAVWANHTAHRRLETQIDVGFKRIAEALNSIAQSRENSAPDTLKHYQDEYADYINSPILSPNSTHSAEDIVFPPKRDIFIPQAFSALSYRSPMELEPNATWEKAFSGEDIGQYISNILRHPQYGMLPLLILGLPGAGKTLLCHMLAAQILRAEYHVIIIQLRDTNAQDTIAKQIDAQIERDFGDPCKWNDLRSAPLDKPILLIFDGYDELLQASGKTYSDYLSKIAEFQSQHERIYHIFVRCIVTSRSTLIDKASIPQNSQILRLRDFDDQRINTWSEIWNQANEQYFKSHNLKKLEIAPGGTVWELAGQPLLLLMLALYDMGGNPLQKQCNISRSELYYRLIRDFVVREREKDPSYHQLDPTRREAEIQNTFRNLGIAALGMYNRRKLFIQTAELSRDLSFLAPKKAGDMNEYSLEECDKLVGSFFFIHSSKSTAQDNTHAKAYEFLHNTFGEFLTAYCILDTAFSLIKRQIRDTEQGEPFSWPAKLKKDWHVCLAYTPLFARPVVLNMLHELSELLAEEKQTDPASVQNALDCLLRDEIRNIITGEFFSVLNETLKMQDNPLEHPELMIHIAAYSVNFILLRATVCSDNFTFAKIAERSDDWEKLTHIWRYAFSEEELTALSAFLMPDRSGEAPRLVYRYDEDAAVQTTSLSKLNKLRSISNVLGDDTLYAVLSAFDFPPDRHIYSILQKEPLGLKTQYAMNALIHCLLSSDEYQSGNLDSLISQLSICCRAESKPLGAFVYCAMLHALSRLHIWDGDTLCLHVHETDLLSLMNHTWQDYAADDNCLFLAIVLNEALEFISVLPLREKTDMLKEFAIFFTCFPLRHSSNSDITKRYISNIFSHFCRTLQSAVEESRDRRIGKTCYELFKIINKEKLHRFISWHELAAALQLCQALEKQGNAKKSIDILFICIYNITIEDLIVDLQKIKRTDPHFLSTAIDCCYYLEQLPSEYDYDKTIFNYLWDQVLERTDAISILFPAYEQSFYHFLHLFHNNVIFPADISLESELNKIMKQYGNQLSIRTLKALLAYGEKSHSLKLCDGVHQLLKA